jgi:transcription-repair coupling factor (superfamily II helicase)
MNAGHAYKQAAALLEQLPERLLAHADFDRVATALSEGAEATIDGVWGSSCALAVAALLHRTAAPMLVLVPQLKQVDALVDDLGLFGVGRVASLPVAEGSLATLADQQGANGQRVRTLKQLVLPAEQAPRVVVASIQGLLRPVPDRQLLAAATTVLKLGDLLDVDRWLEQLVRSGYSATSAVAMPGEFARRGGIIDLFASDWETPVRVELFGDQLESIRRFDIDSQRSLESLEQVEMTVATVDSLGRDCITSYLHDDSWVVMIEPAQSEEVGKQFLQRLEDPGVCHPLPALLARLASRPLASLWTLAPGRSAAHCQVQVESIDRLRGDMDHLRREIDQVAGQGDFVLVSAGRGELERFSEVLSSTQTAQRGGLWMLLGDLAQGFHWADEQVTVVGSGDLLGRVIRRRPARRYHGKPIDDFLDLRQGDLVVHLAHGIGRYRGLSLLDKEGLKQEHLAIEFRGGTRIYVPASRIELVQKYVGGSRSRPRLAMIGGTTWQRQKKAAEAAVQDMAGELLELQARRAARPGITFPADSLWQLEFEAAFPYQETADQLSAMEQIREDMMAPRPMDRLLCGDVGFGKTELAMRAVFKAVDSGYQAAVMVPTTILAEQHYHTFRQRMGQFPIEVARLSRFSSMAEQREVTEGLARGHIDVVIGTHRLASQDVSFANLGLLIIDEEQRFGVKIKERIKSLRSIVDVLTLSATPIPRTLHMSLIGVRDISNLETAPEDRLAVITTVARFEESLVRQAILRELNRGGQTYFVHNRVQDIDQVAARLKALVPEATFGIGHGQMAEAKLERVMVDFVEHRFDVLVATTIVENGLDIPNANTIFIDEADRYGLADLHQLRGRVGRYKHRAACYLLVDSDKPISPNASRRLRAIEEYSQMGAGFAIAMRDLEIRGAGNLLGSQQSGHISTVGYELYCQLMEKAVRKLKKLPPRVAIDVEVDLPGESFLPAEYVPDIRSRIDLYRRFSRIDSAAAVDQLREEMLDRFGPLVPPAERMLQVASLRLEAASWQVTSIGSEQGFLVFHYASRQRIEELARRHPRKLRIVDSRSAYFPLPNGETGVDLLRLAELVLRPATATP